MAKKAKKRFIVRSDLEGVSGLVDPAQAAPGAPEYAEGCRLFMGDLLALVDGLLAGGATEIVVYDEHYYGRNIDLRALPPQVTAICGKPPYREDWAGGIEDGDAGLILLGFHAMEGDPKGILPHTYEPDIKALRLCGTPVGEIGMEAAIAGDLNVPTLLFIGDRAGAEEAKRLIPGVSTVATKEAFSITGGLCLPPSRTAELIRRAAREVATRRPAAKPLQLSPVSLEVELFPTPYTAALREVHPLGWTGAHTLCLEGKTALSVWACYWGLKLSAQAFVAAKMGP
jgi:D-amino peptidase